MISQVIPENSQPLPSFMDSNIFSVPQIWVYFPRVHWGDDFTLGCSSSSTWNYVTTEYYRYTYVP